MRICLDISPAVYRRAGLGRYAQELIAALMAIDAQNEYIAFYNRPSEARPAPLTDSLPTLTVPWGDKPWRLRVLLAHTLSRSQDWLMPGIDLFHACDHLLPRFGRIPSVFTVYDLTYLLLTKTHTTLNHLFLTMMMPRFLCKANAVIAISESTRRDVLRHYTVDAAKVQVIYGGVAPHFKPASHDAVGAIRRKYDLPGCFILAVGTIEPRKNYGTLLKAYRVLRGQGQEVGLVIVGKKGWRYADFFRQLRESGLEGQVKLLGLLPDADLPTIYSAAELFVFPSLYEGFGLPPLEAMACGTPVICSNAASLPEVVGDGGILLEPCDVRALTEAIGRVLTDEHLRADLRTRGLAQARKFSWEHAARATLAVYQKVVKNQDAYLP